MVVGRLRGRRLLAESGRLDIFEVPVFVGFGSQRGLVGSGDLHIDARDLRDCGRVLGGRRGERRCPAIRKCMATWDAINLTAVCWMDRCILRLSGSGSAALCLDGRVRRRSSSRSWLAGRQRLFGDTW